MHVRGRAWHSSAAPRGVNAVEYAARLITAVSNRGRELAAVTGDADFSASTATLSVGPVRGGMSLNVVPDKCTFEVEARALPGQDPQALLSQAPGEAEPLAWEMRRVAPQAAIEIEPPSAYPPLAPPQTAPRRSSWRDWPGGQRGLGARLRHAGRALPAAAGCRSCLRSGQHGRGAPGERVHRGRPAQPGEGLPAPAGRRARRSLSARRRIAVWAGWQAPFWAAQGRGRHSDIRWSEGRDAGHRAENLQPSSGSPPRRVPAGQSWETPEFTDARWVGARPSRLSPSTAP